jgi:streptomycin 6-kinase
MDLRLPDAVANAAAACGAGGWLLDLPGMIAELEAEWSVSVGRPFPHSSEAFVAEATLADSMPVVLKLLSPQDGAAGRHEITMLRLIGGLGCVGLLRDDAARGRCCWSASGLPSTSLPTHSLSGWRYWWRPRPRPRRGGRRRLLAYLLERIKLANSSISSPLSGRSLAIRAPGGRRACPSARRIAAHDDKRAVLVPGDIHELNAPLGPWQRHVVLARHGGVRPLAAS